MLKYNSLMHIEIVKGGPVDMCSRSVVAYFAARSKNRKVYLWLPWTRIEMYCFKNGERVAGRLYLPIET